MKKFTKVSLIIAGILLVLGVVFGVIALALGVRWSTINMEMIDIGFGPDGWHFDIGDMDHEGTYHTLAAGKESCTDVCELSAITGIDVDTDMADIIFEKSDAADSVAVTMEGGYLKHYSYTVDNSTLFIKYDCGKNSYRKGPTFKITIPSGTEFDLLHVNSSLGTIEFHDFTVGADNFEVNTNLGDIIFDHMTVTSDLDANTDLGDVEIESGSFRAVELTTNMGKVEAEATIEGDVRGYSSMGDVKVSIKGDKADFNYDLSTSMGDVSVNGKKEKGDFGMSEVSVSNGGKYNVELETDMGDAALNFH